MIRVYLDNCCYNRPYDDQNSILISLETQAKLYIQSKIDDGNLELAWSFINDYENEINPVEENRLEIQKWKTKAKVIIIKSEQLTEKATSIMKNGIAVKDSLHVASAIISSSNYFLTTDKKLIKKSSSISDICVMNVFDFIKEEVIK